MNVTLEGTTCAGFEWELDGSFSPGKILRRLIIRTTVPCYIRGGAEEFVVQIDPSVLTDLESNPLATDIFRARALRLVYVSSAEAGCGNAFTATSFLTFALTMGVVLFQYCSRRKHDVGLWP